MRCLLEEWEGLPAGYPIHYNGEVVVQIGHLRDKRTQKLVPLHLSEACSPDFPNLFDNNGDEGDPAPAFEVIEAAA